MISLRTVTRSKPRFVPLNTAIIDKERLPGPSTVAAYDRLARDGGIEADPVQRQMALRLDRLLGELVLLRRAAKGSALGWMFSRKKPEPPRGVYLWGGVGRGKTMLMDLFFAEAPVEAKLRLHFHSFMLDTHAAIHRARQTGNRAADPVIEVADLLADKVRLLCFDEFAVTDIADAMILGRLFTRLFERGVVLVATSNVPPHRLYEDGINRGHFVPFTELLSRRCEVIELGNATDYRMLKLGRSEVYLSPLTRETRSQLDRLFLRVAGVERGAPRSLSLLDRSLTIPQAVGRIARFSFAEACGAALGSADYQAIASAFDMVFLTDVPVLDPERRNEARRFITLIDTLYDEGVKLVISAATEPAALYVAHEGNEAFAFDRTASRLIEMRSEAFLAEPRRSDRTAG